MTFNEAYTSLKSLYKSLMFPNNGAARWTLSDIDSLDVHFFYELMEFEQEDHPQKEGEKFLSEVWG